MKKAVIYARYSSDKQTEQSIEGQLYVCNEYAKRHDITILDTYIDRAISGKTDNRADFQKMLKDSSKKNWDYVLVYKLDRFSRNKYETAVHKKTLRDNGVKLLSAMENIPDTPEGILMESLLEGMAEYYSAELAQKVSRGLNESRKKGLFTGGHTLFGYKVVNKKVQVNPEEAEIVKYIFESYANGMTVHEIQEELNNRGIYRYGKPIIKSSLYNMLENKKYIGIVEHNGETFTNIYPKIIDEILFKTVQDISDEHMKGRKVKDRFKEYLLKNKIICGCCGKPMTSDSGTSRNGTTKRYYSCFGRKNGSKCPTKNVKQEIIEDLVISTTINQLSSNENIETIYKKIQEKQNKDETEQNKLKMLEKEKKEIETSINNLLSAIEQGIITTSTKTRINELELMINTVNNEIEYEKLKLSKRITKDDISTYIKKALKQSAFYIIKFLIDKVVYYNDKIKIYYNVTNKKTPDDDSQAFLFCSSFYETVIVYNNKPNTKYVKYETKLLAKI